MKKLAIFIDTNYFCKKTKIKKSGDNKKDKDAYLPIPKTMFKIYDHLSVLYRVENYNLFCDEAIEEKNPLFLITPVFKSEIEDKINNLIPFNDIAKIFEEYICFDKDYDEDEITKAINKYRLYYKQTLEKYLRNCKLIDFALGPSDIAFCCERQYKKLPPFKKKQDSWKDCLNLLYVKKWAELNKAEYDVWFFSRDGDFSDIKEDEFNISFKELDIKGIDDAVESYLKRNDLRYAFQSRLYDNDIEENIVTEITNSFKSYNPSVEDLEVFMNSLKINSIKPQISNQELTGNVNFTVHCNIDINHIDEDVSDEYFVEISASFFTHITNYEKITISNIEIIFIRPSAT
jgi:hypothetical protein